MQGKIRRQGAVERDHIVARRRKAVDASISPETHMESTYIHKQSVFVSVIMKLHWKYTEICHCASTLQSQRISGSSNFNTQDHTQSVWCH